MRDDTCRHLTTSPDAYAVDIVTGRQSPVVLHLCAFADQHPERLVGMPRWLIQEGMSGGRSFEPAKHCPGCPAHERRTERG